MIRFGAVLSCALALGGIVTLRTSAQQLARGQDVAPTFEGWEANQDGSFSMVFGYLNRNFQEEVDIPVGPNNSIDLGDGKGPDRGQPTHFYPRRQRFMFKVAVPKDWDPNKRVIWTLISRGKTNQAKGWRQDEWELNDGVIAENSGGGVLAPNNKAPMMTGPSAQSITLPNFARVTVTAVDDGLPAPGARPLSSTTDRAAAATVQAGGVRVRWSMYRGPGRVVFEQETIPAEYGVPIVAGTNVSFSAPGTYILRATATDNQLFSYHDVTVTVNPPK